MAELNLQHARLIGEKLRAVRQQRQISLRKLARTAEISASMLSRIENGSAYPSVRTIYNIAAALSVPVDYFFPEPGEDGNSISPAASETAAGLMSVTSMQGSKLTWPSNATTMEPIFYEPLSPPVVFAYNRSTIQLEGGVEWSRLAAFAESDAEFMEIVYPLGATSGNTLSRHHGREFGMVLEGELLVELGFSRYTLHVGDSIAFNSTTPHRLSNVRKEKMRALWAVLNRS